jgi:hypothetical protein
VLGVLVELDQLLELEAVEVTEEVDLPLIDASFLL